MPATAFDTLAYANKMKKAGVPEGQAEMHAVTLNQALNEFKKGNLQDLATKQELLDVKQELKEDIADLKREISNTKAETIKWVAGMLVAQIAIGAALLKLLI